MFFISIKNYYKIKFGSWNSFCNGKIYIPELRNYGIKFKNLKRFSYHLISGYIGECKINSIKLVVVMLNQYKHDENSHGLFKTGDSSRNPVLKEYETLHPVRSITKTVMLSINFMWP